MLLRSSVDECGGIAPCFGCILCEKGTFNGDVFVTEEGASLPLLSHFWNDKKAYTQLMQNEKGVWPLKVMWIEEEKTQ